MNLIFQLKLNNRIAISMGKYEFQSHLHTLLRQARVSPMISIYWLTVVQFDSSAYCGAAIIIITKFMKVALSTKKNLLNCLSLIEDK